MADYKYTPADFKSDQIVKWCPGCGDHAILNAVQRAMPEVADALDIPLRSIKSELETPHRRLAMLHLTPQSIILEVCFCTSPEDVAQYRKHQEQLAETLAHHIALLLNIKR